MGLVNSVHRPCPGALHSAPGQGLCTQTYPHCVQQQHPSSTDLQLVNKIFIHVAVFCHMMHYIIVSVAIAVLKTAKESQDIFPATTGTVKTLRE